jgi:poly[(R)-3-hydroxyalkanoate] polymerase subunit PhaC
MSKHESEPVPTGAFEVEAFSRNVARAIEEGGMALAAYLKPREKGEFKHEFSEDVVDIVRTLSRVGQYWLSDPGRAVELQASLGKTYLDLWANAAERMLNADAAPIVTPDPKDKRFAHPEWSSNQFFDFLKQAYLLTAQWADRLVNDAKDLDCWTRQKADFYVRQIVNAISPSNFVLTNPELLRETFGSNAENLVRGMRMLAEDIEAGGGDLKIRQTDVSKFEIGSNIAVTPGKVIFQNELMQLIQYAPSTQKVLKRPVLFVPPWINKFYILDLTPEKSFIKWCIDQGLTVFCISWVNPDARLAEKTFADYMREGPLAALDAIEHATGEREVHAAGYCIGGTLLAITLAYLAAKRDWRVGSATLFTSQIDFTHAGELKVFIDPEQVVSLERRMAERGYMDGRKMAAAFNLLRSNDLIWPYVINNYLKGQAPLPFDLLHWNSDSTHLPAANHSFYLRNCYIENKLSKGEMSIADTRIDLGKVEIPVYSLATREDHIAPARSVLLGSKFFGGPVRFVLAGSGHLAGVINPPSKNKYQYWTGARPSGDDLEAWLAEAEEHPGSWWSNWFDWLKQHDPAEVPARRPGEGKLKVIEDAPGAYVKMTLGGCTATPEPDQAGDEVGDARMVAFARIISERPPPTRRAGGGAAKQQANMTPCDRHEVSDARMAEFRQIVSSTPPPLTASKRRRAKPKAIEDAPRFPVDVVLGGEAATPASNMRPCVGDDISGEVSDERMAAVTHIISSRPPPIGRAGAAAGRRRARRFPAGLCG